VVSKGEMWVFDWNRITRSHSQIMTWRIHFVWIHNCIVQTKEDRLKSKMIACKVVKLLHYFWHIDRTNNYNMN